MNAVGMSTLEIKALIERVLLPDRCHFDERTSGVMDFTLISAADGQDQVTIPGVMLSSLSSTRAIAELVAQARFLMAQAKRGQAGWSSDQKKWNH